ncbi:hypothetical protein VTJ04DRAFT_6700 [Mycothermus thermophilus]|uniref:uncharacterized protein n=1 Tax=Humicola insolens TaxID=85995 RepID=UPI0037438E23
MKTCSVSSRLPKLNTTVPDPRGFAALPKASSSPSSLESPGTSKDRQDCLILIISAPTKTTPIFVIHHVASLHLDDLIPNFYPSTLLINIWRLTLSTTTRERAVWTLKGFYDLHRNAGTHAPYIAGNLLNLLKLDHRARPGPQPQTAETSVDTTSTERR